MCHTIVIQLYDEERGPQTVSTFNITFAEDLRTDQRERARQLHSRTVPYFYKSSFNVDIFAGNGTQETELETAIKLFEAWQRKN